MADTPAVAPKRSHVGRYGLILVLALVILVVGYFMRDSIPGTWLKKIPFLSEIPQVSQPNVLPTQPADSMTGMDHSNMGATMPGLTATPTLPATGAGGIVTVLTLTPTGAATATQTEPASTATVSNQESATSMPQTATPVWTATAPQPSKTLPPTTIVSDVSAEKIRMDLEDLRRILQTTTVMTETFQRGQLTEAELIAVTAQLNVIDQRMEKLTVELQAIEANGDAQILLGQASDLFELMRQTVGIVQTVLAGPSIDSAILAQTQDILEQLLAMVSQLQDLVPSAPNTVEGTSVAPTVTPSATVTLAPTATATAVPGVTATATTAAVSSDQLDQMEIMLSQMIERLGYMQAALDQKQGQPSLTPAP